MTGGFTIEGGADTDTATLNSAVNTSGGSVAVTADMIDLGVDVISGGGSQTFTGAIVVTAGTLIDEVTLSSGGGSIVINGTVDDDAVGGSNRFFEANAGSGDVTLNGAVGATTPLNTFIIQNAGLVSVNSSVAATASFEVRSDEVDFNGGADSISTSGLLRISNNSGSTDGINVGSTDDTATALDLTDTDLAAIADGNTSISIGSNGPLTITGATFKDRLLLASSASNISVAGLVVNDLVDNGDGTGLQDATLIAINGAIVDGGDDATDITANQLKLQTIATSTGIGVHR